MNSNISFHQRSPQKETLQDLTTTLLLSELNLWNLFGPKVIQKSTFQKLSTFIPKNVMHDTLLREIVLYKVRSI